eukprot:1146931-Rhodomonas_salina.1
MGCIDQKTEDLFSYIHLSNGKPASLQEVRTMEECMELVRTQRAVTRAARIYKQGPFSRYVTELAPDQAGPFSQEKPSVADNMWQIKSGGAFEQTIERLKYHAAVESE